MRILRLFFVIIILSQLKCFSQNIELTSSSLLRKNLSYLTGNIKNYDKFVFDKNITILHISNIQNEPILLDIISFRDTIVCFCRVRDLKFYDQTSIIDSILIDTSSYNNFAKYFMDEYHQIPDINSLAMSYIDIRDIFGLACGAAGSPTKSGEKYLKFKKEINNESAKELLLSLNPIYRLMGMLLVKQRGILELEMLFNKFIDNPYKYKYCYGCGGSEDLNIKEIIGDYSKK
jgi:hypothetical protein